MEINKTLNRPFLLQFILIIIALIVYGQVFSFGYNLDDEIVLQFQQYSKNWDGFISALQAPYFSSASGVSYGYRPVTSLSFFIESWLGSSPQTSHIVSWVLYVLNGLLVFRLGTFFFRNNLWAFCLTLIFLVHPTHVEVVASIKNRDELLAFLFALLAFFTLLKNSWASLMGTILLLLLSLLSKKSGIGIIVLAPIAGLFISELSVNKFRVLSLALGISVFYFFPSESVVVRFIGCCSAVGFYLLVERFKVKHQMIWSSLLLSEIMMTVGVVSSIYCLLHFNLTLMMLTNVILLIAFVLNRSIGSRMLLIFSIGILSIFTQQWALLILFSILMQKQPSQNKPIAFLIYAIILGVLGYHIATQSSWVEILMATVYTLPFHIKKLNNVWMKRVCLLSIFLALMINGYNFSKWTYIILLTSLMVIYIVELRGTVRPIIVVVSLVMCSLVILIDPATNLIGDHPIDTSVVDRAINVTNSGRELNFIENPLESQASITSRTMGAANTYGFYIQIFFIPLNLSAYYGYDVVDLFSFPKAMGWVLFGGLGLVMLWRYRLRTQVILLLLFVASLLPFSNVLVPVAGIVGDRLMFIPSLLLTLFVVYLIRGMLPSKKYLKVGLLLIWLVPLSALSFNRTKKWESKMTLFQQDVSNNPRSVKLNELLADWYYYESGLEDSSRLKQAFEYYQSGANLYPDYDRNWYMMGRIRHEQERYKQALEFYLKVQSLEYVGDDLYFNTGVCASEVGEFAMADDFFKKAISIEETSLQAYKQLVVLYLKAKNPRLALSANEAAISAFPQEAELFEIQAKIFFQLGDTENSLLHLRRSIELGNNSEESIRLLERLVDGD